MIKLKIKKIFYFILLVWERRRNEEIAFSFMNIEKRRTNLKQLVKKKKLIYKVKVISILLVGYINLVEF